MADSRVIEVTLKAVADMKDVASNVEQIKRSLNGLVLPKGLESQFTKVFSNLESNIDKASDKLAAGFKSKGDASSYEKTTNQIVKDLTTMSQLMGHIDTSKLNFQVNADALKTINQDIATLQSRLDSLRTERLQALETVRNSPPSGAAAWTNFFEAIDKGTDGVNDAEKALRVLQQQVQKATLHAGNVDNLNEKWKNYANAVEICKQALGLYNGENKEVASLEGEITQKINERERAQEDANVNGRRSVEGLVDATKDANEEEKKFVQGTEESAKAQANLNSELEQFKSRISYFFGMTNAVMLFRRALRSTFDTIKDLDAVMTETAVVTEFDVGDMWSQLPEYTERANKLGVSIHDAYEAATLYYQQGLSTNEVMAVSNETLKMARIAGLEAAEATDRMTNAMRGFNMEITEANAQNVNDVYSNLAAKTASNVDEISTAMTKVASLANNANMSFENTAAFLSQIIETTRESAETAGTALKTVIARFSEVKKLYSEGELLGTDEEGQEIDVNKVSKALRTAGINLNEYLTGMKGLDEIFMELSAKWDSLDQVQQRYIATMAAGSRQQSRFIALMQDNARMTELVGYATDATGASQQQFEKTLDSLESKVNQLKNSWNTFLMGIANSDIIKGAVDLLTNFLDVLNNVSKTMPGLMKSLANMGMLLAGFKISRAIIGKIFPSIAASFKKQSILMGKESGEQTGTSWVSGFRQKFSFKNIFGGQEFTQELNNQLNGALSKLDLDDVKKQEIQTIYEEHGFEAANAKAKEYGANLDQLDAKAKQFQGTQQTTTLSLSKMGGSIMALGGSLMLISNLFDDGTEEGENFARTISKIGTYMLGIGAGITVLGKVLSFFKVQVVTSAFQVGTSISAAGKIAQVGWGWIGLAMTALAGLVALVAKWYKYVKANSPEGKLKKAQEATEKAKEAADQAKQAYDNLNSSIESLRDKYSTLENLTKGTTEWRDAVKETNEKVLELVGSYKELGNYINFKNGVLTIDLESDKVSQILDQYWKNSIVSSTAAIITEENEKLSDIDAKRTKVMEQTYAKLESIEGSQTTYYDLKDKNGKKQSLWQGEHNGKEYDFTSERDLLARALAKDAEALSKIENTFGIKVAEIADPVKYVNDFVSKIDFTDIGWEYLNTLSGTATEKNVKILTEYGQGLVEAEKFQEYYNDQIKTSALVISNLEDEAKEYANNYFNNDKIGALRDQISNELDAELADSSKLALLRDEYAKLYLYQNYEEYKKANEGKDVSEEALKTALLASRATQKLAEEMNAFSLELEKMPDFLKRLYGESEGRGLTRGDINRTQKDFQKDFATAYDKTDFAEVLMDPELFKLYQQSWLDYQEGTGFARERFTEADNRLRNVTKPNFEVDFMGKNITPPTIDLSNIDVDSETYNDLVDNILTIISTSGDAAGVEFKKSFDDVIKGMSPEEIQEFTSALNGIDWSDASQVEGLKEIITGFGVADEKAEDFVQTIINGMDRINVAPLEEIIENLDKTSAIAKKINTGDQERTFSKEDYEAIISTMPELASSFVQSDKDNFTYIGSSMEELGGALGENTAALLENTTKRTEANLGAGGVLKELRGREGWDTEKDSIAEQRSLLAEFLKGAREQNVDLSAMGIEGLGNGSEAFNFTPEKLAKVINELGIVLGNFTSGVYSQEQARQSSEGAALQARQQSMQQNASMVSGENGDVFASAVEAEAYQLGIAEEHIAAYVQQLHSLDAVEKRNAANKLVSLANTQKEIELYDLEAEEVKEFAAQLMAANEQLDPALAMAMATSLSRMEKGYKSLSDAYDDWIGLIDDSGRITKKTGANQAKIFSELKKSVKDLLDTSADLPDSFFESAENMDLLRQVAEGDLEALQKLRAAAAEDYAINAVANLDTSAFSEQFAEFFDWCTQVQLPELEAGAYLNNEPYLTKLHEILVASGATADQLKAFFDSLGFEINYEWRDVTITAPSYKPDPNWDPKSRHSPNIIMTPTTQKGRVRVPTFTFKGNHIDTSVGGGSGRGKSGGGGGKGSKGSGGGGSGSGSKPSYWENPYDELFNLQEKINEALRVREKLERQYQKLLKSTSTSLTQIRKGYTEIVDHLKQEKEYQKELANGRKRQINNAGSQIYTDDDGNRKTYSQMGVTKYANYNFSTGLLQIDWEGLEAISRDSSREEEGKAAEAYINYLQELVDQFEETDETIAGIEEEIENIQQEAIDSYISFEERVQEALITKYEEQIDQFEKLSDSVKDSMDKVISGIQEQIDNERQVRENERTEEDIADKEARLAYLQRDTSGANATEILKLQDELSKAREDYQDSLIDQAIDQMSKDADLAAEQRANQISVMREQLELSKANGELWNEVYSLINNAFNKKGSLNINSELIKLLKETEAFEAMSAFGQDEWIKEVVEAFNNAQKGLTAGKAEKAGAHQNTAPTPKPAATTKPTTSSSSTSSSKKSTPTLTEDIKRHVAAAIWNGSYGWGTGDTRRNRLTEVFGANNGIQALVNQGVGKSGISPAGYSYSDMRKRFKGYKTGGLADYTGLAWLDGTKSKPEMVLNAKDTENLITLKDILAASLRNTSQSGNGSGDNYFDIKIDAEIGSDYDVDQLANKIKRQIQQDGLYRNVNTISHLR